MIAYSGFFYIYCFILCLNTKFYVYIAKCVDNLT